MIIDFYEKILSYKKNDIDLGMFGSYSYRVLKSRDFINLVKEELF